MKYLLFLVVVFAACSSPSEISLNQFSDEKLVHIYELQDKRNSEALIPFLKAKQETHRVAAALAFASIQDSTAIPYLNQMLQIDQDEPQLLLLDRYAIPKHCPFYVLPLMPNSLKSISDIF